jgi:beta-carotene 3-hydroxylase
MISFDFLAVFLLWNVTWLTHKYVMHGFMWYFHEDHHQPKYEHPFERNDIFFIILPSLNRILFYFGAEAGFNYLFLLVWVYCLWSCFMIHVLIHQRFNGSKTQTTSTLLVYVKHIKYTTKHGKRG